MARLVKYNEAPMAWPDVVALLLKYTQLEKQGDTGMYYVARIKQWLGYLRKAYHQADGLFSEVRTLKVSVDIATAIERHAAAIIKSFVRSPFMATFSTSA